MPSKLHITYVVEPDPAALAYRAAQHLVELAEEAVSARGRARIAFSGGSTPKATFKLLADPAHPFLHSMPWHALELFFVGLLGLASLAIAGVSVVVVYNLFRGQR